MGDGEGQYVLLHGVKCLRYVGLSILSLIRLELVADRGQISAGLFYGSYGFILLPTLDIAQPYGGSVTPQYHNALGFYLLS